MLDFGCGLNEIARKVWLGEDKQPSSRKCTIVTIQFGDFGKCYDYWLKPTKHTLVKNQYFVITRGSDTSRVKIINIRNCESLPSHVTKGIELENSAMGVFCYIPKED